MRFIALAACAALLTACATTQAVMPQVELIDRPPLEQVATAELGDTIVEKGRLSTFNGLVLRNEVTWGDGIFMKKFTISPGRLRERQQDAKYRYFYSENMMVYDAMIGTSPYVGGGLCVSRSNVADVRIFIQAGSCGFRPNVAPIVASTRIVDTGEPGFRQELIYNGRSGQTVKFLYREFSGDMIRPPFSQEVQYDLSEGSTIGFRGARVEIVEATNTKLTYRVLSSFLPIGN